jgi:hypothetical protein
MTKNTKTLLTIAGVGVVGYIIYNKFIKKQGSKNFADFTRGGQEGSPVRTRIALPSRRGGRCGETCIMNRCSYPVYGQSGNITSYHTHTCEGQGMGMTVGQMITA